MKLSDLTKQYVVTLNVTNRIVGGTPTAANLIDGWLKAKLPAARQAEKDALKDATVAALPGLVEEKASGMWTTFKRDDAGIYIEGRQVKAMLKEAANILRDILQQKERKAGGEDAKKSKYTNLRSKLAERVFVVEDIIRMRRNGEVLAKVDGCEERAIHVDTAQGPRNALKRSDWVGPCTLRFTLRVLDDGLFQKDLLTLLFEYAGVNGLGADRSQGNGSFELVSLTEQSSPKEKAA